MIEERCQKLQSLKSSQLPYLITSEWICADFAECDITQSSVSQPQEFKLCGLQPPEFTTPSKLAGEFWEPKPTEVEKH